MSYSVCLNTEERNISSPSILREIKRSRELNIENYQVLGTGQVSVPSYYNLEEFSFEAEFPSQDYHYMNSGARATQIITKRCSKGPEEYETGPLYCLQ